jgi:protein-disulfide isomerase-like protein with CxxC motif
MSVERQFDLSINPRRTMMNEQLTAEQEKAIKAVYHFAAEQMKNGMSTQKLQALLIDKGLAPKAAATVVYDLSRLRAAAEQEASKKNMLYGALWCLGGLAVTLITYSDGGSYVIAWGAILYGGIRFFRGLSQSL